MWISDAERKWDHCVVAEIKAAAQSSDLWRIRFGQTVSTPTPKPTTIAQECWTTAAGLQGPGLCHKFREGAPKLFLLQHLLTLVSVWIFHWGCLFGLCSDVDNSQLWVTKSENSSTYHSSVSYCLCIQRTMSNNKSQRTNWSDLDSL